MLIALSDIHENGNMRHASPQDAADKALAASIGALGVLQPVLVRPAPEGGYILVAGHRRFAAARLTGLQEIPAEVTLMGELQSKLAQAAENVVRKPVDPVDLWQRIGSLIDGGYSLQSAGAALGMTDRHIEQMQILSRIAPELLAAMRGQKTMPKWRTLGTIATAPHEQQLTAFERYKYDEGTPPWTSIAAECTAHRIPQERAWFDVATAGVVFEEDLFAEPGSPEQFTTADIAGFMKAQAVAVQEAIQAANEPAIMLDYSRTAQLPKLPSGWIYVERKEALSPRGKFKRAYAIAPANDWNDAGRVVTVVIKPVASTQKKTAAATNAPIQATDDMMEGEAAAPEPPENLPEDACQITKAGQDMLAEARTAALQAALRSPVRLTPERAALALLIAYTAGSHTNKDILAAIVAPDGTITVPEPETLAQMIGEALARSLSITPPHRQNSTHLSAEHYNRPEWIGALIKADDLMPELDTPEFLACVGGRTLQTVAQSNVAIEDLQDMPSKVADLRRWLCGRLPLWTPTHSGAPGPSTQPWAPSPKKQQDHMLGKAGNDS